MLRKQQQRNTSEPLAVFMQKYEERKVAGSIPTQENEDFLAFFPFNLAVMMIQLMCYSVLVYILIIVNVWD